MVLALLSPPLLILYCSAEDYTIPTPNQTGKRTVPQVKARY